MPQLFFTRTRGHWVARLTGILRALFYLVFPITLVLGFLLSIAALATVAVAARQLYIQHLPPGAIPSCGAPLSMMLKFMPLTTVIRKVLTGSGECSVVNWRFLGLAMPAWVLIWAAFLGAAGVSANARRA